MFNLRDLFRICFNFGIGNIGPPHASGISRLWPILTNFIYLMDFLYLQRGLESRPCRERLYIRCLLYDNPLEKSLYALQTIVLLLLLFTSSIFKDTLYFLLKYVLPPVLFFTLTQVVLLLIISTLTRVQIQSNLGTTGTVFFMNMKGMIRYTAFRILLAFSNG